MDKEMLVYIDGQYYPKSQAKISVFDHGFLYGDGVFEGIRAYNGFVFKLKEHINRLYQSAHMMALQIPLTKEQMIEAAVEILRKNKLRDAYIRLVVTRGTGDLGLDPRKCTKPTLLIIAGDIVLHRKDAREEGITALVSWIRRHPVDSTSHEIKSLNYLNSIMSKIEANNSGVDEAICLDTNGFVSEATGENIFIVKNGRILTPPTCSGQLPGITAQVVMELAAKLGVEVMESNITPYQLFNADEAFLTGTGAEIVPIREINKRQIGSGHPGPVTKQLISEFQKVVFDPKEGVSIYP